MLELKFNPNEMKEYINCLPKIKEDFFDMIRVDIKKSSEKFINTLMNTELELFLGREKYERPQLLSTNKNYRNGFYTRTIAVKGVGKLHIRVPRDRNGEFSTNVIEKYERCENTIKEDVAAL